MDASVEFLLGNLKQLVEYHVNLVGTASSELASLNDELDQFKAVLKEASHKYVKNEVYKKWESDIREAVYDIEDTIDTCVTQTAADAAKKTSHFKRLFKGTPITLAEAVKSLRKVRVQPLLSTLDKFEKFTKLADSPDNIVAEARDTRQKKTQNIVGFEKEAEDFIAFLNGVSEKVEIASIVGMAGLGKTTLTWKIFEDSRIKYEFPVRLWVNISDVLNMRKFLVTILKNFTSTVPDCSDEDLILEVREHLKEGKFFIVMDDVWTIDAWDKIQRILPRDNPLGRVLVTTRMKNVAVHSATRTPHYLRFLTMQESWELLQYEVYHQLNAVPYELEGVGQVIAKDCDGLPLSLVVIGGILVEKKAGAQNIMETKKEWEEVSMSVKSNLVDGDKKKLLSSIISLSYEKIPYELKNCFLYLGVFPEDAEIPVSELLRLWIAEGFILKCVGKSLEQIALNNLKELINRNLVMVKEAKPDGEPKVCHIHDSVREICKTEGKFENLNLFQEITWSATEGIFEPKDNVEKFRRICIHSYVLNFLKTTNKKVPKARSFLCFHQTPMLLKPVDMASITDGFGLLRVYDAKNIKFPKFPQKFVNLLHLRYLTLVVENCTSLPELISELWNLQTLIVDITSSTLEIKADIWKMRQLRHLKTKASIILRRDGKGDGGENLQTLSRLSPESCTEEVFKKAKNLITLGIQGELNKLPNSGCLSYLDNLHKLKLVNAVPNGVAAENRLRHLPEPRNFPPKLKIIVLHGTYLDWEQMSVLASLSHLEVLKLKENAFKGSSWDAKHVFTELQRLHIERSNEIVTWKARTNPFPELRYLFLSNCEKLIEVPPTICEKLETLSVERVTKELVSSVEAIGLDKLKQGAAFKLDIAPADLLPKA